jgi:hypothetical protein
MEFWTAQKGFNEVTKSQNQGEDMSAMFFGLSKGVQKQGVAPCFTWDQ